MKITIEKVDNGMVLKAKDYSGVFLYDEESPNGLLDFFYAQCDILGISGSRYDKERINIRLVHGDKYECKDKDCEICHKEI